MNNETVSEFSDVILQLGHGDFRRHGDIELAIYDPRYGGPNQIPHLKWTGFPICGRGVIFAKHVVLDRELRILRYEGDLFDTVFVDDGVLGVECVMDDKTFATFLRKWYIPEDAYTMKPKIRFSFERFGFENYNQMTINSGWYVSREPRKTNIQKEIGYSSLNILSIDSESV